MLLLLLQPVKHPRVLAQSVQLAPTPLVARHSLACHVGGPTLALKEPGRSLTVLRSTLALLVRSTGRPQASLSASTTASANRAMAHLQNLVVRVAYARGGATRLAEV